MGFRFEALSLGEERLAEKPLTASRPAEDMAPALRRAVERLRLDCPMWGRAKTAHCLRAEASRPDAPSGTCSPNSWRAAWFGPCRPCADASRLVGPGRSFFWGTFKYPLLTPGVDLTLARMGSWGALRALFYRRDSWLAGGAGGGRNASSCLPACPGLLDAAALQRLVPVASAATIVQWRLP